MKRSEESTTKQSSEEQISNLHCWKCRKCVASSGCFMNYLGNQVTEDRNESVDAQNTCHLWHMNIETLPDWINCRVQQAQWTVGKLNCPSCGARLGGFNFVSTPKCSCGQLAAVHLCKSRTDHQAAQASRLMRPALKYLSHPGVPSAWDKETLRTGGGSRTRNHRLLSMAWNNSGLGRLAEALCLEVRATHFEMKNEKLLFKASDPKYQPFVPQLAAGRCTSRASHRKSHSLDLSISEKLILLPTLYEIHSKTTAYPTLNETRPIDLSGLALSCSKSSCSFQNTPSFDPNTLLHRLSMAPHETQAQRGREFPCGLEASSVYSDHANANSLTFLMDLPSAGRSMLEASDQEEHLSPLDFLRSASFPLGTINHRLNNRERSKLRTLRRQRRRRERWLQKQGKYSGVGLLDHMTLSNEMSTDDEAEYTEEKDSYICAVCLDVYFNPYMCHPCHHIFCEPCLRTLARDNPSSTPCPLCRTIISRVFLQTELNNATKTFFTKEYLKIKQSFQKSSSAKWPLPSCRKGFHLFGGFHRRAAPVTRRQFPHGAHRMDYLHFEDDSRGWWFDMDMVIIYIYSVNWVIGFIVFCFLCYFFFPF
ncbi:E3 ubiquitin-protein ligase RNF180 isoform X1 [Meriones unguiculatus]|uniref:E3 ubiquitin-protein ligase RNF180 isoform X1 n=1 Tax=Meriones unguiculatus TaxID=10047 RepID=UPI000B4FB1CC|nr:E3 ubiquitin-protein ligase RNF180 isoform X1 [Meriones unguiculatus]XP_021509704.1 E3 ubiquitin-protein ligase RNF180 isoform X1 [Meriones unguiculatus]XP_021509705.1 E3 ubiquitin-protein ligase RNF180 [Meriones unguiculatus]XP_060241672.1 E3 ubiquitin-protein ligase RNF180 isoform X1 [Meriones unguiculatus]